VERPSGTREELVVRRIRPEEWPEYRDLRLRALETDPLAFGSTLQRERGFEETRWKERIAGNPPSSPSTTWVAVEGSGRFVGMVVAARVDGAFHIFAMWISPDARGKGTGGRLLDAAIAWVHEVSPGSAILLEVNRRSPAATHLYESRGFRSTGRVSPLSHTPGEQVHEMVLPG
jgi:ribosomal protein S18 acetylase RimI-like enzyme